MKIFKVECTVSEMRNLIQGIDMMHTKCIDNLQAIHPLDGNGPNQKQYFKDKLPELTEQRRALNEILMNG